MQKESEHVIEYEMHETQHMVMEQIAIANEIIRHEVRESFREIIKPLNHRHAIYFILMQTAAFVRKKEKEGEVESKQASFLLKEIDEKIAKLKTEPIKIETIKVSQSIQKCFELREIFGKPFVDKLAEEYSEQEEKVIKNHVIDKKGR